MKNTPCLVSLRLTKAFFVFAVIISGSTHAGAAPGANIPDSSDMKAGADAQKAGMAERMACCGKASAEIACKFAEFNGAPELAGNKMGRCMQNCMNNPEMYKCPK